MPCIICNVLQEVPDDEGLMSVKCATCGNTQSEATLRERERIIKLLDEAFIYDTPVVIQREQLIALIKGENK
jgi:hypothetical protein